MKRDVWFVFLFVVTGLTIIQALSFSDNNQANFDNGTYVNTIYNGSAVVLVGSNLTGTFTSRIFDAGSESVWNNLTFNSETPSLISLFAVDSAADVWKSVNSGSNWSLIVDDYNGGDGNGATDLEKNSTDLILVFNQDLWSSSDKGVTWNKINNNYNGAEGQNADVLGIDSNNYIYIIEGDQDVWRSVDGGTSFTKLISNFNGGNGVVFGLAINSTGAIFAVDSAADVWNSLDQGATWNLVKDDFNGVIGNNADDIVIDSNNNLYIVDRQDFWRSNDNGVTWTLINDDINGAGDSNDGLVLHVDSDSNIYIIDGSEDVFKSTNLGVDFNLVALNFNGGSGNVFGLNSIVENSGLTFQVQNCSLSNCGDGNWQSINLSNINLTGRYFQYKVDFTSPDSSIIPSVHNVSIDYTIINSAPVISIVLPQEGNTYGYNESLALNFSVSDIDGNLESCWYWIDDGVNISLGTNGNCQNTTFNVSNEAHFLKIYANDTNGELSNDSVSFSVSVGSPTITLYFPIDVYLNYNDVTFNYTPSDIDLDSCEMWGDFNGIWKVNQTDSSPLSDAVNNFNLTLSDSSYLWNIRCNDTQGNSAFNGNKTFVVDTTAPNLTLNEPSGTQFSQTNILIQWNVTDDNLNTCWYNKTFSTGELIGSNFNVVNCSSGSSTTFVATDGNYILSFFANDSAGNKSSVSKAFTVTTSTGGGSSGGGGGGGGGGGSTTIIRPGNATTIIDLSVEKVSDIVADAGDIKKVTWGVENIGTAFLNDCKFLAGGLQKSWIDNGGQKDLSAGEQYDFVFDINIPDDAESGSYNIILSLVCKEVTKTTSFKIDILNKELGLKLVKVERSDKDKVRVVYSVEELSGLDQNLEFQFIIFDSNNERVAEISESKTISANGKEEYETLIPIDALLSGDLSLLVNLNSDTYSTFVQENIVLGKFKTTGLTIFDNFGGTNTIISMVIGVLFLAFAVVMVIRILKLRKKVNPRRREGFVKRFFKVH